MSISEPELDETEHYSCQKKNHPTALVSYVFWRSPSLPLIFSHPISMSIKDCEVWHLQEEQEHCFPLALFPRSQLSTMVMPRANCCLNPFQGCFSLPYNFHRGSAAVAVMKCAPLLWSVLLSSPTCNKAPFYFSFFFFLGFVSTFHSHQQVLFGTWVSEGLLTEMRSFATGVIQLAGSAWPSAWPISPASNAGGPSRLSGRGGP